MVRQITTFIILTQVLFGWGKTGHRIVGEIAETYLTKNAKTQIKKLLKLLFQIVADLENEVRLRLGKLYS